MADTDLVAVRPGNVRIAVDAADGAAAGTRGGRGPRDVDRSRGGAVERRSATLAAARWADRGGRGRSAGLRRADEGQKLAGAVPAGVSPSPVAAVEAARERAEESGRPRHSSPAAIVTRRTSCVRDAVWAGPPARSLRAARSTSMDDSGARAMAGVTVVRDGDFLGVVAPTERAARTRGRGHQGRTGASRPTSQRLRPSTSI